MIQRQPKIHVVTDLEFFKSHIFLFGMMAILLIGNFVAGGFIQLQGNNSRLVVVALAGLAVQPFLISLFIAMFPAEIMFRLVFSAVAATTILVSFFFGMSIFNSKYAFNTTSDWLAAVPLSLILFTIPYLIPKLLFSWRLEWPELGPASKWNKICSTESQSHQLSITNLFIMMTFVAASCSFLTLVKLDFEKLILLLLVASGIQCLIFLPLSQVIFLKGGFVLCLAWSVSLGLVIEVACGENIGLFAGFSIMVYGTFLTCVKITGFELKSGTF